MCHQSKRCNPRIHGYQHKSGSSCKYHRNPLGIVSFGGGIATAWPRREARRNIDRDTYTPYALTGEPGKAIWD